MAMGRASFSATRGSFARRTSSVPFPIDDEDDDQMGCTQTGIELRRLGLSRVRWPTPVALALLTLTLRVYLPIFGYVDRHATVFS